MRAGFTLPFFFSVLGVLVVVSGVCGGSDSQSEFVADILRQVSELRQHVDATEVVEVRFSQEQLSTYGVDVAELSERLKGLNARLYVYDKGLFTHESSEEEFEEEPDGDVEEESLVGSGSHLADTDFEDLDSLGFGSDAFDDEVEDPAALREAEERAIVESWGVGHDPLAAAAAAWSAQQHGNRDEALVLWNHAANHGSLEAHLVLAFHKMSRPARRHGIAASTFFDNIGPSTVDRCNAAYHHYHEAAEISASASADGDGAAVEDFFLEDEFMFEIPEVNPEVEQETLEYLRELSDTGDVGAANDLGTAYSMGIWGANVNQSEAAKWFRISAKRGSSTGYAQLGWLYLAGNVENHPEASSDPLDPSASFSKQDGSAYDGDSSGGIEMGAGADTPGAVGTNQPADEHMIDDAPQTPADAGSASIVGDEHTATGEQRDTTSHSRKKAKKNSPQTLRAIKLLTRAANMGNSHAQANLGFAYMGAHAKNGVPANYTRARFWFEKAGRVTGLDSDQDLQFDWSSRTPRHIHARSEAEADSIHLDDLSDTFADVDMNVDVPNPDALLSLGDMAHSGLGGTIINNTKAIQLFEAAASFGSLQALLHLGQVHWSGWYGLMRGTSQHVRRDCLSAVKSLKDVAYSNSLIADLTREAYVALKGERESNVTHAIELYERLANMGHLSSISNLAFLHHHGWIASDGQDNLASNRSESFFWTRLAVGERERHNIVRLGDFFYYPELSSSAGHSVNKTRAYVLWARAARDANDSRALFNLAYGKIMGEAPVGLQGEPRELLTRALDWDINGWLAILPWLVYSDVSEWWLSGSDWAGQIVSQAMIPFAEMSDVLLISILTLLLGALAFVRQNLARPNR